MLGHKDLPGYFFCHLIEIWDLLVNYNHNIITIDFPFYIHPTKRKTGVCQSDFLHVSQHLGSLLCQWKSLSQYHSSE